MAYKNWKKNYHSKRIGNKWKEEGFCDWWDFGRDWVEYYSKSAYRYSYVRRNHRLEPYVFTIYDAGWRYKRNVPGIHKPISQISYYEACELSEEYGEIERKVLLAAGGYKNGRKTYFKKVYNHRRRRIGKRYCELAAYGRFDEADNLDQGKDKHFGWDID